IGAAFAAQRRDAFADLNGGEPIAGEEWAGVRDVLEHFRQIEVRSVRVLDPVRGAEPTLRLEITARGIAANAAGRVADLPAAWWVHAQTTAAGLRVRGMETGEHALAVALLAARDDRERHALLAAAPNLVHRRMVAELMPLAWHQYVDAGGGSV